MSALELLRTQHEDLLKQIRTAIETASTPGADGAEAPGMTDEQFGAVGVLRARADRVADQIELLDKQETRSRAVEETAARLAENSESGEGEKSGNVEHRGQQVGGGAQTRDRDPGHYRTVTDGGEHSFFADQYRALKLGNTAAMRRLTEDQNFRAGQLPQHRALTMTGEGPGTTMPKWLLERFELVLRQGRPLANAVQNLPLGSDPRPMTLPKQTVGTSTVLADQGGENVAPATTDQFDTDVDTITPGTLTGAQVVSRQFLDSATPAIDMLIMNDLVANYNLQIEKKVGAAMITAAGSAVATFATEAAFVGTLPAVPSVDAVIDAAVLVRAGRYLPADIIAMGTRRFGAFKKLKDTTGRPLMPITGGTMNIFGQLNPVDVDGEIEGLGIIATEGISTGAYAESFVVARASDTLLWEGDMMRFRYEEVTGPQSIKLGIWNYYALSVRRPGVGQKRIVVTAA